MIRSGPNRFSETCLLTGVVFALLALTLVPRGASARPGPGTDLVKAYQQEVANAEQYWEAENYAASRAHYEKAYQIEPRPILLFNIASTFRREENHRRAISYYRQFLDLAPDGHELRALAQEAVEFLTELVRREEARAIAAATASAAEPERPPDARSSPGRGLLVGGVATAGAGALALGFGAYQGKRARDRERYFENLPDGHVWTAEDDDRYAQGESFERRAILLSIVGAAALAAGASLSIVGHRRGTATDERTLGVVPVGGASEAGLTLFGQF